MSQHKFNHLGRTLLAGRIICNFGQSTINCVVRRISDHGATIEVESQFGIPQHFHLLIPDEGMPRPCKLVWQSGREIGLEFEPAGIRENAAAEPDHPEQPSHPVLSAQMLALRSAVDESEIGVVLLNSDLRAQIINRAFRKMWNVPDALANSRPAFIALLYYCRDSKAYQTAPSDLDAFIAERLRLIKAGDTNPFDLRRSNGEIIRAQCTVLPDGGRLLTYTDVTDIVRHSDELEVLHNALDNLQDGVVLLDADLNAQFLNGKMRKYFDVSDQQAAAHPAYAELIAHAPNPRGRDLSAEARNEFIAGRIADVRAAKPSVRDLRIPDGRDIRVHCAEMANGGRMLTYCDVTDLIRNTEQLEKLATIDSMSGLYNRRHFLVLAEAEWSRFQRHHRPLSILMIDIDHFKTVNDRFGHAIGDEAIASLAAACREAKRAADIVGRLGGEEFAILLPETDQAQAWISAERLREKVAAQALSAQGVEYKLTISLGVAEATAGMSGVETLLRSADWALYQAKEDGRNRTALWSPTPTLCAAARVLPAAG